MTTPFIIVSSPPSGSTMLRKLLHSPPQICCHGELFGPRRVLGHEEAGLPGHLVAEPDQQSALLDVRTADPLEFVRMILAAGATFEAIGFKMLNDHVVDQQFHAAVEWLAGLTDLRVVYMRRRNILRQHVSRLRLRETARRGELAEAVRTGEPPVIDPSLAVRVDGDEVLAEAARQRALTSQIRHRFGSSRSMDIVYEDFAAAPLTIGRAVLDFLAVPRFQLELATPRNEYDLRIVIENYEEIAAVPELSAYLG